MCGLDCKVVSFHEVVVAFVKVGCAVGKAVSTVEDCVFNGYYWMFINFLNGFCKT